MSQKVSVSKYWVLFLAIFANMIQVFKSVDFCRDKQDLTRTKIMKTTEVGQLQRFGYI